MAKRKVILTVAQTGNFQGKAQNPGLNPDVLIQGFRGEHPEFPVVYTHCHRREILDDRKKTYR